MPKVRRRKPARLVDDRQGYRKSRFDLRMAAVAKKKPLRDERKSRLQFQIGSERRQTARLLENNFNIRSWVCVLKLYYVFVAEFGETRNRAAYPILHNPEVCSLNTSNKAAQGLCDGHMHKSLRRSLP